MADDPTTEQIKENTAAKQENTSATNDNTFANQQSSTQNQKQNDLLEKQNNLYNEVSESLDKHGISIKNAGGVLTSLGSIMSGTLNQLADYKNKMVAAAGANNNISVSSNAAGEMIGFMSQQLIGASKAYDQLKPTNSRLFSDQFKSAWEGAVQLKSTFGDLSGAAKNILTNLGVPLDKTNSIIRSAGGSTSLLSSLVTKQIERFGAAADNNNRLRDTYLNVMSASGNLDKTWLAAGKNLDGLNGILQSQQNMLHGVMGATGRSEEEVVKYWEAWSRIPGALNEVNIAGKSIDGMTAKFNLAAATQRKVEDIQDDMTNALRNYNITGEKALTYTARMTELNSKFGMELSDVRGYMTEMSSAFKFLGDQTNATSNIFNKLMTSFKETGLSAKASTELISGITSHIGKLSIAQKAFLSAQSGGPGGLMGGFQIEKLMREGKTDQVFDMIQKQMKSQFGRIVTVEEAAKSPEAAARLVRQREMLKQGPLGQFADTDEKAQAILNAFKKGERIDVKSLATPDKLLEGTAARAEAWQNKTRIPAFNTIEKELAQIRAQGSLATGKLIDKTLSGNALDPALRELGSTLRKEGEKQAVESGRQIRRDTEIGRGRERTQLNVNATGRELRRTVTALPGVGRAAARTVGEYFPPKTTERAAEEKKVFDQNVERERTRGRTTNTQALAVSANVPATDAITKHLEQMRLQSQTAKTTTATTAPVSPKDFIEKYISKDEKIMKNEGAMNIMRANRLIEGNVVSTKEASEDKDAAQKLMQQRQLISQALGTSMEDSGKTLEMLAALRQTVSNVKVEDKLVPSAKIMEDKERAASARVGTLAPVPPARVPEARAPGAATTTAATRGQAGQSVIKFDPLNIRITVDREGHAKVDYVSELHARASGSPPTGVNGSK